MRIDSVCVSAARLRSVREERDQRDSQGDGAGEVADLALKDAGGNWRNAADFVEGLPHFRDVGVFAGGRGITAEGFDGGLQILRRPHLAGADRPLGEVFDTAAEVHAEAGHASRDRRDRSGGC